MIVSAKAGWNKSVLHVYHNTYPDSPNYCVPVKVGDVPYQRSRFQSKQSVFESAAKHFGLDVSKARYVEKSDVCMGGRRDLSKLLIPGEGHNYYSVGFFS